MVDKLTEEEQKEYDRLQKLERFWKLTWKSLPENVKAKLEWFRKRLWEEIKTSNKDIDERGSDVLGISEELKEYRERWKKIVNLSDDVKEKIIKTVNNIPVKIEVDSDGSRLIEFKLKNKTYRILNPRLKDHTDEEYRNRVSYTSRKLHEDYVELWWMMWDNVDEWKNGKLKEYVKEKQREWLHIAKKEEMEVLLNELSEQADLSSEVSTIGMLAYLTGIYWWYWLDMKNKCVRWILNCYWKYSYGFVEHEEVKACGNLLMMSCN